MKLIRKRKLLEYYERCDIIVRGSHCFVADGVVVHNTSAHISIGRLGGETPTVKYFSGGTKPEIFATIFDKADLLARWEQNAYPDMTIYGESYGGKEQGMRLTYGDKPRFCAFEVKIRDSWLNVVSAEEMVKKLGLEFVHYVRIPAAVEEIDKQRDADSVQAIRNGMGEGKKREGVVLRPIIELTDNSGARIIAKHKRADFRETATKREVNQEDLIVLAKVSAIVDEWVTENRARNILSKWQESDITPKNTSKFIRLMYEDVTTEGKDEIIESKDLSRAVGRKAAKIYMAEIARRAEIK